MTNWFPNWRTKQPRLRLRSPRNDYYHSTGKQLIRRGYKAATAEEKYMSVALLMLLIQNVWYMRG
jgi:hypothetical protein